MTLVPAPAPTVIKMLQIRCKAGTRVITGRLSVSGAIVKVKIGNKSYKKALVKGKKFTLKSVRLKKKTKITIKVTKQKCKSFVKVYRVR